MTKYSKDSDEKFNSDEIQVFHLKDISNLSDNEIDSYAKEISEVLKKSKPSIDLDDDPINRILTAILLGKTKEEFTYELNDEWDQYWDKVAIEVKEIQDAGHIVAYPSEFD